MNGARLGKGAFCPKIDEGLARQGVEQGQRNLQAADVSPCGKEKAVHIMIIQEVWTAEILRKICQTILQIASQAGKRPALQSKGLPESLASEEVEGAIQAASKTKLSISWQSYFPK